MNGMKMNCMKRRTFLSVSASAAVLGPAFILNHVQAGADPLRAAVIGHTGRGDYGHGLESIFNGRPGIVVVGLADPDPDGRSRAAAKAGALRTYADWRQMLEREKPNLVSLAMRHADQHFEIGRDVLRAGAHLYCEKPFTRTPAEADELLEEAARRNLKIAVAHTYRLQQNIVRLKQALEEGFLGELVEMRAYGKQDARAGGEDMMVLGSHLFDLFRMFAGDPLWCTARVLAGDRDITRSDARLVKDNVGLVAGDRVFAHFAFKNGVNATFTSAAALRETTAGWGIELHCAKGVARIHIDLEPVVFVRKSTAWQASGRTDTWHPLSATVLKGAEPRVTNPVTDWLDAIAENREPVCSGKDGAWAIEMVMGVYQAALTEKRVWFPLTVRTHPLA